MASVVMRAWPKGVVQVTVRVMNEDIRARASERFGAHLSDTAQKITARAWHDMVTAWRWWRMARPRKYVSVERSEPEPWEDRTLRAQQTRAAYSIGSALRDQEWVCASNIAGIASGVIRASRESRA